MHQKTARERRMAADENVDTDKYAEACGEQLPSHTQHLHDAASADKQTDYLI